MKNKFKGENTMKKNKLFQSALSLMLVGGMLTACGSSASSTADRKSVV